MLFRDINYFSPRDQGIKPLHLHMTRLSIILFYIIAAVTLVLAGGGNSSCEESSTAPRVAVSPTRFVETDGHGGEKKCKEDDEVSSINGNSTPRFRSHTPSPQSRSSVPFEQRPLVTPSIGGAAYSSPETTLSPAKLVQTEAMRVSSKEYYKKRNNKEKEKKQSKSKKDGRDRFPRNGRSSTDSQKPDQSNSSLTKPPTPTNTKTISTANDALRENLIFIQRILLFTAAVTFIGILVYSVYYINLIRNVYAKERESE